MSQVVLTAARVDCLGGKTAVRAERTASEWRTAVRADCLNGETAARVDSPAIDVGKRLFAWRQGPWVREGSILSVTLPNEATRARAERAMKCVAGA